MSVQRRLTALAHRGQHREHRDAILLLLLAALIGRLLGGLALGRLGTEGRGLGHGLHGLAGGIRSAALVTLGTASLIGIDAPLAVAALTLEVGRAQVELVAPLVRAQHAVLLEVFEPIDLGLDGLDLSSLGSLLGRFGNTRLSASVLAGGAPLERGPLGGEELAAVAAGLLIRLNGALGAPDQLDADLLGAGDAMGALAHMHLDRRFGDLGDHRHLITLLHEQSAQGGQLVGLVGHVHYSTS